MRARKHHRTYYAQLPVGNPTNPWKTMEKTPLTNQQPNKPTGKHHRRVYDKAEKVIGDLNGWTAFVEVRKENEEEGFRIASEYRQDLIARFDFARLSRKKKMDSTFINYFVNPIQLALRL